jgi:hypothetical protein
VTAPDRADPPRADPPRAARDLTAGLAALRDDLDRAADDDDDAEEPRP